MNTSPLIIIIIVILIFNIVLLKKKKLKPNDPKIKQWYAGCADQGNLVLCLLPILPQPRLAPLDLLNCP